MSCGQGAARTRLAAHLGRCTAQPAFERAFDAQIGVLQGWTSVKSVKSVGARGAGAHLDLIPREVRGRARFGRERPAERRSPRPRRSAGSVLVVAPFTSRWPTTRDGSVGPADEPSTVRRFPTVAVAAVDGAAARSDYPRSYNPAPLRSSTRHGRRGIKPRHYRLFEQPAVSCWGPMDAKGVAMDLLLIVRDALASAPRWDTLLAARDAHDAGRSVGC